MRKKNPLVRAERSSSPPRALVRPRRTKPRFLRFILRRSFLLTVFNPEPHRLITRQQMRYPARKSKCHVRRLETLACLSYIPERSSCIAFHIDHTPLAILQLLIILQIL